MVRRLHERGIGWFACATTLDDALAAQQAGADVIVAQGMEAGGLDKDNYRAEQSAALATEEPADEVITRCGGMSPPCSPDHAKIARSSSGPAHRRNNNRHNLTVMIQTGQPDD
ncbi:MAG: nitronate monooxygenase [Pseudonocardiaceae bacterium]